MTNVPLTGWLMNSRHFSVLGAGKSKVLVALMSGETFFLIYRQHCLAMSSHGKKGWESLCSLFYKDTNSLHEGSTLMT